MLIYVLEDLNEDSQLQNKDALLAALSLASIVALTSNDAISH